jgi:hypothetical protein
MPRVYSKKSKSLNKKKYFKKSRKTSKNKRSKKRTNKRKRRLTSKKGGAVWTPEQNLKKCRRYITSCFPGMSQCPLHTECTSITEENREEAKEKAKNYLESHIKTKAGLDNLNCDEYINEVLIPKSNFCI